jgi:uncharacterized DUF497 family protein
VRCEWDSEKARRSLSKHGLSFEDAETVFEGPTVTFEDDRFDYGEERFITLGMLAGHVVVIAHTLRGEERTRIISMRKAIVVSRKSIKSNVAKLERLADENIDYSDIPSLDEAFRSRAVRVPWPPAKRQLTIRLDEDVLAWLKSFGKGYQTRINRILRIAMESRAPRPRTTRPRAPRIKKPSATKRV